MAEGEKVIGKHLYAASSAAAGTRTASNGPAGPSDGSRRGGQSDEVIDVEFEQGT